MLILPIKKKWYDMLLSGEKKEEYREMSPYYRARFMNAGLLDQFGLEEEKVVELFKFQNGYSKSSAYFIAKCSLSIKTGNPEWGAEPGKEYYVLKIIEIVEVVNSGVD